MRPLKSPVMDGLTWVVVVCIVGIVAALILIIRQG